MNERIRKIENLNKEQFLNMFENWFNSYNFVIEYFLPDFEDDVKNNKEYLIEVALENFDSRCVYGLFNYCKQENNNFYVIEDDEFLGEDYDNFYNERLEQIKKIREVKKTSKRIKDK